MSFLDSLVASSLPFLPRALLWRVARRYIAGQSLEEALGVVAALREAGCRATLDVLGEDVQEESAARAAADAYRDLLDRLDAEGLPAGISIKLSQLGLRFAPELAVELVDGVMRRASKLDRFVRIDMEDSSLTSRTLEIYRRLGEKSTRIGVVLQAALRRSPDDLDALLELGPERVDVRVCKGIYREAPEIAYRGRKRIRSQFMRLVDRLVESGAHGAIATHDPKLVDASLERLRGLEPVHRARFEMQMLHGVGESLRPRVLDQGVRLRIYVPFGANWHAYSLRRLRENPTIARYVLKDVLARPLASPAGS